MAGIAVGATDEHWSEDGVDDNTCDDVGREPGGFGEPVRLAQFVFANEIDVVSDQGWELLQFADVSGLEEEVLIGDEFIVSVRGQGANSSEGEARHSGINGAVGGATPSREENRRR